MNSAPDPDAYTRREEIAMDQGVSTPYLVESKRSGQTKHRTQTNRKRPSSSGRRNRLPEGTDSELDPYWNGAVDPSVVKVDKEVASSIVSELREKLFEGKLAKMRAEGASESEINAAIRKRQEQFQK